MTNKRLSILLILMMVIAPVSAAFNHCSSMEMAGAPPEQSSQVDGHHSDANNLGHHKMAQGAQADKTDYINYDCSAHSCICGILSSTPKLHRPIAFGYSNLNPLFPFSAAVSPEIKPPLA